MIDLRMDAVRERTRGLEGGITGGDALRELDARMLWSALVEPGDGVAGILVGALGAVEALDFALGSAGAAFGGDRVRVEPGALRAARARWSGRAAEATQAARAAAQAGVIPVTPAAEGWPYRVDDLGVHGPLCLWVRGDPRALAGDGGSLALVGARAATSYGDHVVAEIAAELAAEGVTIVSGAAYGIDGAAHRAALAAGGLTTAWLAGGVDRPYPAGHRDLLARIVASGGAVAAEVPCGSAPTKWRFLSRNRLIAAAAEATVVVEAGWRSGSLNTAGHAATLGRPLGAVPGAVTSAASAGCHRLLREYDAICVTSAQDARELLAPRPPGPGAGSDSEELMSAVGDTLSARTPHGVEWIAVRIGRLPSEVETALGLLSLEGRAERVGEGWRSANR